MKTRALAFIPQVHRTTHRIALHLERLGDPVGQGEAHVLAGLASGGPATIGEIHRAFAHKRSTLTSILDRLEQQGFVARDTNPDDRRSFVVRLTAEGEETGRRVLAHLAEFEAGVLATVSRADLRGFNAVLDALEQASGPDLPAAAAVGRVRAGARNRSAGRRGMSRGRLR
jgi:DNA-binding MarR family transcriptional regulator